MLSQMLILYCPLGIIWTLIEFSLAKNWRSKIEPK